jgi:GAF domain-containing protein
MEPVPETVEAVDALEPAGENGGLLDTLVELANRAQELVPDLVGVSIGWRDERLTFTLVATAGDIAALDAVQYLAGGPCVEGADVGGARTYEGDDPLDEERWRLFAEATAARAVRSTLSLPLIRDDRVQGTVNLYAGSRRAFVGQHDGLAAIFGGWALGAVTNADLSFSTREEAARTPQRVREQQVVDMAVGILVGQLRVEVDVAEERLRTAAALAGITVGQLAAGVVAAREHHDR